MGAYLEDVGAAEMDTPNDNWGYGFVKWTEQPEMALAYFGGYGENVDAFPMGEHTPFMMVLDEATPTGPQMVEAWDLLCSTMIPGFPLADPRLIRLWDEDDHRVYGFDRETLLRSTRYRLGTPPQH